MKTSSHTTKFINVGKQSKLDSFLNEYGKAVKYYVHNLWYNKYEVKGRILNIKNNQLCTFTFNPDQTSPPNTDLSGRALKCAKQQALAMVNAAITDQSKRLYVLKNKQGQATNVNDYKALQRKIDKTTIYIPKFTRVNAELNSICAEYISSNNHFDGYLILKSIGKKYGKISIPIKQTKHSNQFDYMKKSFLVSSKKIYFRWDTATPVKKTTGSVVGVDQGILSCVCLSDGQTTQTDIHGHNLKTIIDKISKKKKGSHGFKKATDHRKNYVNWSINQLNLDGIKEIRLEGLKHVGRGAKKSRFLSHFAYSLIKDKLENRCVHEGVRFRTTNPMYRSQRCNECGYVHKSNRKGKAFLCKNCGHSRDADMNAACNNRDDLFSIPFGFRQSKLNKTGFFWKKSGLYDFDMGTYSSPQLTKKYDFLGLL